MARRRRFARARTVYRKARSGYRRASRGGFGGGSMIHKIEGALGKGILYQGVASKFAGPQLGSIAGLYGEYKGGGLVGLGITELLVKPFLGMPSALGSLNLGNILGNIGGGGGQSGGNTGGAV
jgi:hypothetical protein